VKFIPGATKKGKAARAAVEGFLTTPIVSKGGDVEKMTPQEKDLLMSLKGMICMALS